MRIDGHMRLLLRRTTQVAVVLSVLFALTLPASAVETHQWTPEIAQAVTTRVVDGDTIEVLYKGHEYVVRMIGVDTPETVHPRRPVEPFGEEASRFTSKLLKRRLARVRCRPIRPVWQNPGVRLDQASELLV